MIEKRPGRGNLSTVQFPEAWVERHGEPPTDDEGWRKWVKANHVADLVDYVEGRSVPHLDKRAADLELAAMRENR